MRVLPPIAGAAFAALASTAPSLAQTCLKVDDKAEATIRGTLATVRFVHPGNQSRQTAYVVNLGRPVCADVTDLDNKVQRVDKVGRVQLAGEFDPTKVIRLMGKRVTARGTLFGQHTAYHIAPVLISVKSLEPAK
jgi:hypothetical protein